MKRIMTVCVVLAMVFGMCACSAQSAPEPTVSAYADVIARLEDGDFDGARSLIDAMEGGEVPLETVSGASQLPEMTLPSGQPEPVDTTHCETVELAQYNVREYFTFEERFYIGKESGCTQYIILKEEYRDRLAAMENVKLEVSYLLCEAHGTIDQKAEQFRSEYYEPISRKELTVELDSNGMGIISNMSYNTRKGYFPDYAMDMEITSGSGKLFLRMQ